MVQITKKIKIQGGLADVAVADASDIAKKSSKLSFVEAAALPIAYITSLQSLRDYGSDNI